MPEEDISFMPHSHLMQAHEIEVIAKEFVNRGVTKIRLTGGEPLVRKDAAEIIQSLSKLPVELTLTTNGSRVHEFIDLFKSTGIKSVNVSLDTLNKEKFQSITQRKTFDRVKDNIQLLIDQGFHVKVNAVIMRGMNEDEIPQFIEWTKDQPLHMRFIEFMPFQGNRWEDTKVYTYQEILNTVASNYDFIKLNDARHETAKKFKVIGHQGTFAIISTMSAPFCHDCNRLRLTADGKMKNCLFSKGETNILEALRQGKNLTPFIEQCLSEKKESLGGQFTTEYENLDATSLDNRSMINIGG
jgi:cyclic pyranopterin phosphate synthase